jgi:general secretion pathway protein L
MSRLADIAAALRSWLGEAAVGFAGATSAFRRPSILRLTETDGGEFCVERFGGRVGWETLSPSISFEDGAFAAPLEPRMRAAMRGARVEIVLRVRHFLVRQLRLPAGAAPFLEGVARAQIDRITPWRATEAAFGVSAPERLGEDRIVAHVVATPRARLALYLRALSPFGADALIIATEVEGDGGAAKIPVLTESVGDAVRVQRWSLVLRAGFCGALVSAILALGAWSYFGLSLDSEREALQSAIAARRAALISERGAHESETLAALDEKKRGVLPAVLALDALSQALPDGAYLTELSIEPGKVALSGLTDDAPGLVRLIEQSGRFSHAVFASPTTHAPNEAGERFHIEAVVEPNRTKAP